ncbi:hypothetical protein MTO96_042566, partial [Rhipicephalus appendiculatus]
TLALFSSGRRPSLSVASVEVREAALRWRETTWGHAGRHSFPRALSDVGPGVVQIGADLGPVMDGPRVRDEWVHLTDDPGSGESAVMRPNTGGGQ